MDSSSCDKTSLSASNSVKKDFRRKAHDSEMEPRFDGRPGAVDWGWSPGIGDAILIGVSAPDNGSLVSYLSVVFARVSINADGTAVAPINTHVVLLMACLSDTMRGRHRCIIIIILYAALLAACGHLPPLGSGKVK